MAAMRLSQLGGLLAFVHPLPDGRGDIARGVLNEGARLAKMLGTIWSAAYFGGCEPGDQEDLFAHGVPEVVRIEPDFDINDV